MKTWKLLSLLLICVCLLCGCMVSAETATRGQASTDKENNHAEELSLAEQIKAADAVVICYYDMEKNNGSYAEVFRSEENEILQTFINAFQDWDPAQNKTECEDTDLMAVVYLGDIKICCDVYTEYSVIFAPGPGYYNLPEGFIDLVKQYLAIDN